MPDGVESNGIKSVPLLANNFIYIYISGLVAQAVSPKAIEA